MFFPPGEPVGNRVKLPMSPRGDTRQGLPLDFFTVKPNLTNSFYTKSSGCCSLYVYIYIYTYKTDRCIYVNSSAYIVVCSIGEPLANSKQLEPQRREQITVPSVPCDIFHSCHADDGNSKSPRSIVVNSLVSTSSQLHIILDMIYGCSQL